MFELLVATELTDEALSLLRAADGVSVQTVPPTERAIREGLKTAHALISRDEVLLDAAVLADAPHLKVIGRVSAGLDGIDIEAATLRGVVVTHTPGTSAIAAGEHALALMLALSRRLVIAHNSLKEGWWLLDRRRQAGTQLQGKTLGIIGYGRVGRVVAARALAFGMTVIANDPYLSDEQIDERRVLRVSLMELLARADFVSLHVPNTPETRGLVDADFIAQMQPGARLINTAFGAAVDETALAAALKAGHLAGAALDVFAEEPPYNSPLVGLEQVIHTPHIGENTVEAAQDLAHQIVEQVLDALQGRDYRNVVNLPFMPGLEFDTLRPYLTLAERIGALLHLLSRSAPHQETAIARVAVEYRGEDVGGMIKPLTVALLKGLLAPMLGESVSYINAPVLAAERGIQVMQTKGLKTGDYTHLLICQVVLDDGEEIIMSGALLDGKEPHIVQVNAYRLNVVPEGHLLIMGSYDRPGVIGRVGTLMSENGVNIASWQTGRAEPGGHTLTVLTLDQPVPGPVFDALLQEDFIRHAQQIALPG